jgi:hypothetical protein
MRLLKFFKHSLPDHQTTHQSAPPQPAIDPMKKAELDELLLEISFEDLDAIHELASRMKRSNTFDIDVLIREARERAANL